MTKRRSYSDFKGSVVRAAVRMAGKGVGSGKQAGAVRQVKPQRSSAVEGS